MAKNYEIVNQLQRERKRIAKQDLATKTYRELPEAPYNLGYAMAAVELAVEAGYKPRWGSYKNNTARWIDQNGITVVTERGLHAGAWLLIRNCLAEATGAQNGKE